VPGVLSSNRGRDFGSFLGALVELGYGFSYRVLDSQYFGVAQRRKRIFIVGCLGDNGRTPAEILAIAESRSGYFESFEQKRQNITSDASKSTGDDSRSLIHTFSKSRRAQNAEDYETWLQRGVVPTLNDFDNKTSTRATVLFLFEATRVDDVRIHKDVSPTVPTYWGTGGSRVPYWSTNPIRRLTPVECERLQGFPDNWTAGQTDGHRYKQMGNAVAVPVVDWIIRRLVSL